MMTATVCALCRRIESLKTQDNSNLIHEFKNSYLFAGDHQTFEGYCVLVLKKHIEELFDLSDDLQREFHGEMLTVSRAIQRAYHPEKMNLSNYGNLTPHQHWHIFPRYVNDKAWPQPPWAVAKIFDQNHTTEVQARLIAEKLQPYLK